MTYVIETLIVECVFRALGIGRALSLFQLATRREDRLSSESPLGTVAVICDATHLGVESRCILKSGARYAGGCC